MAREKDKKKVRTYPANLEAEKSVLGAFLIDPRAVTDHISALLPEDFSSAPNKAIFEGDDHYMIDPAKCTECKGFFDKPQCAVICPVGAPCKAE